MKARSIFTKNNVMCLPFTIQLLQPPIRSGPLERRHFQELLKCASKFQRRREIQYIIVIQFKPDLQQQVLQMTRHNQYLTATFPCKYALHCVWPRLSTLGMTNIIVYFYVANSCSQLYIHNNSITPETASFTWRPDPYSPKIMLCASL